MRRCAAARATRLRRSRGQRVELIAGVRLRLLLFCSCSCVRSRSGFDGRDAALGNLARANRALVGADQQAQIVPALDEVAKRARPDQDVEITEVAVFVDVDQPPLEHVVVAVSANAARRRAATRIPLDPPLGRAD